MQAARHGGYAIVGVEQCATSVPLPRFPFEQRTVLVLGREMDGIPAKLLRLMDACIEIPQQGILRSLNVHVSGALVCYDYVCKTQLPPQ